MVSNALYSIAEVWKEIVNSQATDEINESFSSDTHLCFDPLKSCHVP